MNNKLNLTLSITLLYSFSSLANTTPQIAEVNTIIEQKAQQLDEQHNLLMTATERDNYKIKVIAKKLAEKKVANPELTINDLVNDGAATYQINDTYQQRQLFLELEVMGNGAGIEPPK